jgi:hypothetical protein
MGELPVRRFYRFARVYIVLIDGLGQQRASSRKLQMVDRGEKYQLIMGIDIIQYKFLPGS